mgnify:CR=1 FL=1
MNISVGCIDKDFSRLSKMHELDPSIKSFSSIEESFEHNFSGYILATPASTHTELAKTLISNHKPVLIEKPLALSLQESKQIKSYVDKFAGKVVVDIACGRMHAVAMTADGSVYTWGSGRDGALGHGRRKGRRRCQQPDTHD